MQFIRDPQGRPVAILGVSRDVGERKKLQVQLQQAQKMEAVGTLASGIAHDFNNILQAISGYTQLLIGSEQIREANRATLKMRKMGKAGRLPSRSIQPHLR